MIRAIAIGLLSAASLPAHDLWLIPPEKSTAKEPAVVLVHQGMEFPKSTNAANVKAFGQAYVIGPDREKVNLAPLAAEEKSGRMSFTPAKAGLHVLAVETSPKKIELDAEEFNAYLVSDGMPQIFKLRHDEKSLNQPGKEQYRKSVKAIVRVGGSNDGDVEKPLGLPLEIVPLVNPLTRKIGETLPIRVLYHGKPLADANLGWAYPGDGEAPRGTLRSDEKGEALIPISKTGLMTIRLTHMTRPKTPEYEWESFWTTLTFRIDAR